MSDLNELLESVAITDILSEPTQERTTASQTSSQEEASAFAPNSDDFSEAPLGWNGKSEPIEPAPEPEEPYDAEAEATNLVNMISAGNCIVMTPIANLKLVKSFGGRSQIKKMKSSFAKKNSGAELSDEEKTLADGYANYSAQLGLASGDIMYSPEQIQMLKTAALPMCQRKQMKVNADWAFWSVLLGVQTDKVFKVLMK